MDGFPPLSSGARLRRRVDSILPVLSARIAILEADAQTRAKARRKTKHVVGTLDEACERIDLLEEQMGELRLLVATLLGLHQMDEDWNPAIFHELRDRLDAKDGVVDGKLDDIPRKEARAEKERAEEEQARLKRAEETRKRHAALRELEIRAAKATFKRRERGD